MAYNFNEHIDRRGTNSIKWEYGPVAEKRTEMPDLLPMWVADMDLPSPEPVRRALRERAEHPIYGYTMVPDSLLQAFRSWHEGRHGTRIAPEEIISVTGVMPAVEAAVAAFTEPGDGIVVQTPVYFPFYNAISKQGRRLLRNPLREEQGGYRMDFDGLRRALDGAAKMLLLSSPHNPVGRVWTREELATVGEICRERGVFILSDEIHCDVLLNGHRFTSILEVDPETRKESMVAVSPSKTFNIAGTSVAQVVLPDEERRHAFKRAVMARGIWMPSLFGVTATEAAYAEGEEWLDELLVYLGENDRVLREELAARLPEVRVAPLEGTFIAWLDFRAVLEARGRSHAELRRAVENAGLWPSDGPQFGDEGEGFQRLNIALPRDLLREALSRLERAIAAL